MPGTDAVATRVLVVYDIYAWALDVLLRTPPV